MLTKLQTTLRLSSLKDMLIYKLNVAPETAAWLAPMARDVARANGVDLLSFRGGELLSHFFWEMDRAGKSAELEQVAQDSAQFADYLQTVRGIFAKHGIQSAA